MLIYLFRKK